MIRPFRDRARQSPQGGARGGTGRGVAVVALAALGWSCRPSPQPPAPPAAAAATTAVAPPAGDRTWVGKVWVATDPSAAPGTMRILLADGTLVMDSCFETYRLARWRALDDGRIAWEEDSETIEADIAESTADRLRLRLHLRGDIKEETYRPATVPTVCPDMTRE